VTDLDEMQKRLKAIAEVVNSFKSESVQLRVVDVLLGHLGVPPGEGNDVTPATPKRTKRRKASAKAEPAAKNRRRGTLQNPRGRPPRLSGLQAHSQ